jgi:hypothetical protein
MRKLVLLGVAGLTLAVGVGFAANAISRDSIGLAPTPAGSGIELSPAKTSGAAAAKPAAPSVRRKATKPKAAPRPGSATTTATGTKTSGITTPVPSAPTSTDDHGGRSRGGTGGGSGGGGGHGGDD